MSAARRRSTAGRSRRSATSRKKRGPLSSPSAAPRNTRAAGAAVERRARWWYRLRGYRILAANSWVGGYELDLVVRRGRRLVFCEVKAKRSDRFGDPLEMVSPEKQRRLRRAAESWLVAHPDEGGLEVSFDVIVERDGRIARLADAF